MDDDQVDDTKKSIILDLISQLRQGTDLHKITLPTFILEPRSMCERLSDFFCFQQYLIDAGLVEDDLERISLITKWIFSGHHTRPVGVKKVFI